MNMNHSMIARGAIFVLIVAAIAAIGMLTSCNSAQARGRHHVNHHRAHHHVAHHRATRHSHAEDANGNGVIGSRPAGCPHQFCGCEASRYLFGRIIPALNLARNWIKQFPRTSPAPGMVAARAHHVFVLMSHASGLDWLVHDGNSGHGLTREHVRSIAGYVVVNPSVRLAMR